MASNRRKGAEEEEQEEEEEEEEVKKGDGELLFLVFATIFSSTKMSRNCRAEMRFIPRVIVFAAFIFLVLSLFFYSRFKETTNSYEGFLLQLNGKMFSFLKGGMRTI